MTLSIGIVTNRHRRFAHPAQVSELATEMKSYAKTLPGSVFVVDRRQGANGEERSGLGLQGTGREDMSMNVTCPNCATIYRVDPAKVPESGVRARCAVCSAVFAGAAARRAIASGAAPSRRDRAGTPPSRTAADSTPAWRASPTARRSRLPPRPARASGAPPAPPEPATLRGRQPRPSRPPAAGRTGRVLPPPRPAAPVRPAPARRRLGTGRRSHALRHPPACRSARAPAQPSAPRGATPPPPRAAPGARPVNPFLSQDPALKARRLARALISDMVVYHPGKRQEGLRDGNLKELFEEEIKKSWEEYADQVGREVAESTAVLQRSAERDPRRRPADLLRGTADGRGEIDRSSPVSPSLLASINLPISLPME